MIYSDYFENSLEFENPLKLVLFAWSKNIATKA